MTAEACPLRHERAQYPSHADLKRRRGVIEALLGRPARDAFFESEAEYFPGRLRIVHCNVYCIVHRNVPDMLVWDRADLSFVQYYLAPYYSRAFPGNFEQVFIREAGQFAINFS